MDGDSAYVVILELDFIGMDADAHLDAQTPHHVPDGDRAAL